MNTPTVEELIELARRAPAPPGQDFVGVRDEDIAEAEAKIGRPLSNGLRRWLHSVNGAMLGPGGVFGIRDADDVLSFEKYLRIYPEWRKRSWVPVASDGVGNYWVAVPFGPDGSPDWIAFVDTHEDPLNVSRYAASNFLHFMRFLLNSELGETRWPGDKEYDLEHDPALVNVPVEQAPWYRR
jgi:hypothetical protein